MSEIHAAVSDLLERSPLSSRPTIAAWMAAVVVLLAGPFVFDAYYFRILFLVVMWSGLALSWNIVGGYIRYPSFGHVAFFGLGAFTVGLGGRYFGLGDSLGPELVATLLLAGVVPTLLAAAIAYPTLQLRGAYFGVTTLGIALVITELFSIFDVLGGGVGVAAPTFEPVLLSVQQILYFLMLTVLVVLVGTLVVIQRTRLGYGFAAIRADEDAAEMVGIPTTRYKTIAFVLSAFFPGIIGGIYVYYLGYFTASSIYALETGIDMIIFTVIGGIGTIAGPIIGSALMVVLKYVVLADFLQVHVLLTGSFIIVVLLFFPSGIMGILADARRGDFDLPVLLKRRDSDE